MNKCYVRRNLEENKRVLGGFTLLALLIDVFVVGTPIVLSYFQKVPSIREINLLASHLFVLVLYFFCLGIIKGSYNFHLILSVTGNRGAYLRQVIVWGVAVSTIFSLISMILAYVIGLMVVIFINPRGIAFVGVNVSYFLEVPLLLWTVINMGFVVGALFYRLRARSFGVLVASGIWMIIINENYKTMGIFMSALKPWEYTLSGVFCLCIGIVLLRKAPIMCYAHDLI